jgi:hypothetical protein
VTLHEDALEPSLEMELHADSLESFAQRRDDFG